MCEIPTVIAGCLLALAVWDALALLRELLVSR